MSINTVQKHRETALNSEFIARWQQRKYQAELALFYNRMFQYIYARPTGEFVWLSAISALPVKEYNQADAAFYGLEYSQRIQISKRLAAKGHLKNVLRRNADGSNEEFPSQGYRLWNAGLRWEQVLGGRSYSVSLRGDNLANRRYTSHLSSYKGLAPNPGFGLALKSRVEF